jgi:hypothetical protein
MARDTEQGSECACVSTLGGGYDATLPCIVEPEAAIGPRRGARVAGVGVG